MTESLPGTISPRNVDTFTYKVLKPESLPQLKGKEEFKCWPWGTNFAWVIHLGPIVSNNQIREWESQGLIQRLTPGKIPFAQEVTGSPVQTNPANPANPATGV